MPNIFTALQMLRDLRNTSYLSVEQKKFLNKILEEEALPEIIKYPSSLKLKHINALLREEIDHSSYWNRTAPLTNLKYIRELNQALTILTTLENELKEKEKPDYNSHYSESLSKKLDYLYEETVKTYSGQIMLPVMQEFDNAIGPFNAGQCFGYVAKWALDLLLHKTAFGIQIDSSPIFHPIKLLSKTGRKYPDLNHLARMNDTISNYQTHQKNLQDYLQASSEKSPDDIYIYDSIIPHFYSSITQMAKDLITLSNENTVVGLNLHRFFSGHALGFAYQNGKYHFFDSNTGWYRFDKPEAFIQWLPFYFQTLRYDKRYLEISTIRYSKVAVIGEEVASRKVNTNAFSRYALQLILSPITVPIVTIFAGYYFGIRGLIYGVNDIKNKLFNWGSSPLKNLEDNRAKDDNMNDILVKNDNDNNKFFSSYRSVEALLDVPRKEIVDLAKKAVNNPLFQKKINQNVTFEKDTPINRDVTVTSNIVSAPLFFKPKIETETIKMIDTAVKNIQNSSHYYRWEAKKQKLNVLSAGKDVLNNKITFEQFKQILHDNPNYADAIGQSNTEIIIKRILDRASNNQHNSLENPNTPKLQQRVTS